MVLDASSTSDSYDAFPDSPDPYGTDSLSSTNPVVIDRAQLPKPLPIIGALFGFREPRMSGWAAERIRYYTSILGRSPTQKESEAIWYHSYKSMAIQSYGRPMWFGFGIYQAYKSRETYRFPFYGPLKTPDGWWNGERIRIMGVDLIDGPLARLGVHATRGSVYGLIALGFGGLLVSSYATTVAVVGELRDPRLKDVQRAKAGQRNKQKGDLEAMKQPNDSTGQGNTSAGDLWRRHREGIGAQDDASPSAGPEGYGGDIERLGGMNTGILSDAQMRSQETRQQASPRESPAENRASTFQLDRVEKQPIGFGDTFDDASPTAQSSADDGQKGSAWDRIRRQAQRQASGTKQGDRGWDSIRKEQEAGSTTGDSFTFSSAEQERHLAQDEAQKEFDARVERERQGGSFNENRGKRW
ncbi:MAG: hypothetical protein Q9225_006214 [Loekoesia sp. 1 TL-2023]